MGRRLPAASRSGLGEASYNGAGRVWLGPVAPVGRRLPAGVAARARRGQLHLGHCRTRGRTGGIEGMLPTVMPYGPFSGSPPLAAEPRGVGCGMGYLLLILLAVLLVPLVYVVLSRRAGGANSSEGQRPIGKPVMFTEPSADEPTPAASSAPKDTTEAQRRTPAA